MSAGLRAGVPSCRSARDLRDTEAMTDTRPQQRSNASSSGSGKARLDAIDRRILAALQDNARITYQNLAEKAGLSPRPTLERVRRLEARGIIRGYTARLDPVASGYPIVALAAIQLRDHAAPARHQFERVLLASPSVVGIEVPSGDFDYLARIVAASLADYEALTGAWLGDARLGVSRIVTTFILKSVKDFTGYPIEADASDA
jgi:Lrp/AsnC family leucine-responsive transcriptional regulator